jgi:hypothetical protein
MTPSGSRELLAGLDIFDTVSADFCPPEFRAGGWHTKESAVVAVPEAAANENRNTVFWQH